MPKLSGFQVVITLEPQRRKDLFPLAIYSAFGNTWIKKSTNKIGDIMSRAGNSSLCRLMENAGITQEGLSRKSGVALSIIRALFHGRYRYRNPQAKTLKRLADALGLSVPRMKSIIKGCREKPASRSRKAS